MRRSEQKGRTEIAEGLNVLIDSNGYRSHSQEGVPCQLCARHSPRNSEGREGRGTEKGGWNSSNEAFIYPRLPQEVAQIRDQTAHSTAVLDCIIIHNPKSSLAGAGARAARRITSVVRAKF